VAAFGVGVSDGNGVKVGVIVGGLGDGGSKVAVGKGVQLGTRVGPNKAVAVSGRSVAVAGSGVAVI